MGRFELIYKQHISSGILKIIRDKETGVQYLVSSGLGVSGMTPLLDKNKEVVCSLEENFD